MRSESSRSRWTRSSTCPTACTRAASGALAIRMEHVLRVARLPRHHRDPFDRLLVAQAQVERLPLLTADAVLRQYDVEILPAR